MGAKGWIATFVIGGFVVLAAAVTYASSNQAAQVAEDASELAQAEQLLSSFSILRSNLGIAVTLGRAEGEAPEGSADVAAAVEVTLASADEVVAQADLLDAMTIDLSLGSRLERLTTAVAAFAEDAPAPAMEGAVVDVIDALDDLEEDVAIFSAAKAASVEAQADRAGNLATTASYTVAILTPILLILAARWLARRRHEQAADEQVLRRRERTAGATVDLVDSLSERLRRPDVGIHGLARILAGVLDRPAQPEERPMLQEVASLILEESNGFGRALDDVVAHARMADGSLHIEAEPIEPGPALQPVFDDVDGSRHVKIALDDAVVLADPELLRQMVRNLLWDRFERSGPRVDVRGVSNDVRYVISVGSFAADAEAPKESDPESRRSGGPARLGLTVVQELATEMSGSVRYVGREGWTGFDLELPLATDID